MTSLYYIDFSEAKISVARIVFSKRLALEIGRNAAQIVCEKPAISKANKEEGLCKKPPEKVTEIAAAKAKRLIMAL